MHCSGRLRLLQTPPPKVTKDGIKPYPTDGARTLDSRTGFYYSVTGITPAMIMRLPNVGSQYLDGLHGRDGNAFDGGKTYKVTLPPDIPAARFWSFTVYDNQTRSMLDTPQRYPRAGSQSYPSPAAEAERRWLDDGRTSARRSRPASTAATGSRRCPARVVHDPAPLQPAAAVLRQELATERDRIGEVRR